VKVKAKSHAARRRRSIERRFVPLTEAKARLSEIVDGVWTREDRVTITRNGRPVATLLSPAEIASLDATIDVLSDPDLMAQIRRSRREIEAGRAKTYTIEELDRLLGP